MSRNRDLTQALKDALKKAGLTYAQVAVHLQLSEASVKRLFKECSFSVSRMEQVCELAGADLLELVRSVDDKQARVLELSEAQERELADNLPLLIAAICVLNRYRFEDVLAEYEIDPHLLQQMFAQLDRLGIIELLPENRYRLRVSRGFQWRKNGPIEQFFIRSVLSSFLDRKLVRTQDSFRFAWGTVSAETATNFIQRLRRLYDDFNEAADADAQLPLAKRTGAGLLLAFRNEWEPEDMRAFKKPGANSGG
ncbi:MAG: XRE family transcriptional regulator [Pseudomonadota bacterium]